MYIRISHQRNVPTWPARALQHVSLHLASWWQVLALWNQRRQTAAQFASLDERLSRDIPSVDDVPRRAAALSSDSRGGHVLSMMLLRMP